MEELLARHRKEARDLQSRVTQKKKQATKKTRRGVNDECDRLERELKAKHEQEIADLNSGGETATTAEGEAEGLLEDKLEDLHVEDEAGEQKPPTESAESSQPNGTSIAAESDSQRTKKPSRQKARLARRAAEQAALTEQAELEASALPDLRAQEREVMSKLIDGLGLVEREVRSDGHCMYSAVALALSNPASKTTAATSNTPAPPPSAAASPTQKPWTYQTVRTQTADFIASHPSDFEPFLDEPLKSYTTKIASTAEWGGELELNAISRWTRRTVKVVLGEGGVRVIDPDEVGTGKGDADDETIWLAYYRKSFGLGEHYNALQRRG